MKEGAIYEVEPKRLMDFKIQTDEKLRRIYHRIYINLFTTGKLDVDQSKMKHCFFFGLVFIKIIIIEILFKSNIFFY